MIFLNKIIFNIFNIVMIVAVIFQSFVDNKNDSRS